MNQETNQGISTQPAGHDEAQAAAAEAAQHVVDSVTSWHASGEESTIAAELREGLAEAEVSVSAAEQARLVSKIDAVKDTTDGAPTVRDAEVSASD